MYERGVLRRYPEKQDTAWASAQLGMTRLIHMARKKRHGFRRALFQPRPLLFLIFVVVLDRFDAAIVLRLSFRIFHRLLGFGGFFGAGFSAFLALFVQHFFAAKQFEESLVGAVALVPAS